MRVLFDGVAPVDYGQIYLTSRELPDMTAAFAGQANGLCGAGEPGVLFLMVGTSYGRVRIRIELHDAEPPPPGPEWGEVVEVSLRPRAAVISLLPWGDGPLATMPLLAEGQDAGPLPVHRVRYCAAGMDEGRDPYGGHDRSQFEDGDHGYFDDRPDRYLLCLWQEASVRADAVVRRTGPAAEYWHTWVAGLPAAPTLWERVEAELRARAARERREAERGLRDEARRWGGRAPSARLRQVRGNVHGIARLDRDLVDGIAEADPATQRRIAVWAARRAFAAAGVADVGWLAPAWAALERGDPLPAEFTDMPALLIRLLRGRTGWLTGWGRPARTRAVATAVPALAAAALPDPLQGALEAVWAAATAHATGSAEFLQEIRRAFPVVDR